MSGALGAARSAQPPPARSGLARTWPDAGRLGRVRVIATDIDGTLLRTGSPIAERTARALDACAAAGIIVIPVTGRPIRWMAPISEQVPHLPLTICSNGAVVYDLQARRVVHAELVEEASLADFALRRSQLIPRARLGFETLDGLLVEPDFAAQLPAGARRVELGDWRTAQAAGVVKVLVRLEGQMDSDALLHQVEPLARGCMHATHSNPANGLVELAPAGVTKAGALARFCAERGIGAHEVAAFGDMPNDLEMLAWAGSGFAVEGGHPRVLAACEHRSPALDEGGIGPVIEAILAARPA
ncbi:HAD-IIB family hydrolase [Brevibacterium sp. 5221]|uniref:HAD-IIB family hydrolase n=1 Tax=Brevibacterium rongguiense TaxID=2695267 RepID=A0A6N9H913_9MICO|nr:HAD family hydrolase [Brevibacterium rongguiense]MYM20321.1 HAD-IIB family hydrolase [Brevibacterium rongguiense]